MIDEKLAHGFGRQAMRQVSGEGHDLLAFIKARVEPIMQRIYTGKSIRPVDFNPAVNSIMTRLEDAHSSVFGSFHPMKVSRVSRSKDIEGQFDASALMSVKAATRRGSEPLQNTPCYTVYNISLTGRHNHLMVCKVASPFHFYQHAVRRYIERSGVAESAVPAVADITLPIFHLSLLYLAAGIHVDARFHDLDVAVPLIDTPGQGAFLGQIVVLPNSSEIGCRQDTRRHKNDAGSYRWTRERGVDIQTFYGAAYLTREQDKALESLRAWYLEREDEIHQLSLGLVYSSYEPTENQMKLILDFASLIHREGFAELFSHARRLNARSGMKRHLSVEEEESQQDAALVAAA